MKHLKRFNEAIVDWETDNIKNFYQEAKDSIDEFITFDQLKEIGLKHDIEVVDYDTFYAELPSDKMRDDAPPKGTYPFFGLCNPVTHKARMVLVRHKLSPKDLDFAYHMLKHENVHVGQKTKKKDKSSGEFLGDMSDTKSYFSNKDEVMAFAQSVSDMVMSKNPKTLEQAIKLLDGIGMYQHIKRTVDIDIFNRYKKYIYLYLEKEFNKKIK